MLVTDVHMPGKMDGLDLARQMRLREPQLPILLVTGRPDILDDLAHEEMKASLLAKPFSLGMLTATVTRLLASPL
jgi:DNA-binding response OmpR family regulator